MKLGAFVAGLGTGYVTGENLRRQEEAGKRAERALKIQEDSAAITNQLQQEQLDQVRRQQATQRQLADLVDEFNGTKPAPGEQREDGPSPPPTRSDGDRIGFGLYRNPDLLANSDFATRAGQIFLRAGMPEGIAWLERAGKAQKENAITALRHLVGGDTQAAADAFNQTGQYQVTGIEDLGGGKFRVGFNNGQTKDIDPQRALRSYLSPKDFFELAMKEPYYAAYADQLRGKNEAGVTRAEIAGDARIAAAGINADGRVDAATIRAGAVRGAPAGTTRTPASTRAGSAEGGVLPDKWLSDFETNHLPTRDATDAGGGKRVDPKTGQAVQEVDEDTAPIVRDLARMNADVLARARVQPQEAGAVFNQFAKAFKEGDRAKAFAALDKGGRIVVATDNDGQPVRVLGRIGTASDRNPILFDLPEGMERMLLEQEFRNRDTRAGQRADQAERARLRAGDPGKPKPAAARGVNVPTAAPVGDMLEAPPQGDLEPAGPVSQVPPKERSAKARDAFRTQLAQESDERARRRAADDLAEERERVEAPKRRMAEGFRALVRSGRYTEADRPILEDAAASDYLSEAERARAAELLRKLGGKRPAAAAGVNP